MCGCSLHNHPPRRRSTRSALASFSDDGPGTVTKSQRRRNKIGIRPSTRAAWPPSTCGDDDRLNILARALGTEGLGLPIWPPLAQCRGHKRGGGGGSCPPPVSKQGHVISLLFSVYRDHATTSFASAGCTKRGGE